MNVSKNLTWPMVASTNLKSLKPQLATPDPEAVQLSSGCLNSIMDESISPARAAYDNISDMQDKQAFAEKVMLVLCTKPDASAGREYDHQLVQLVKQLITKLDIDMKAKRANAMDTSISSTKQDVSLQQSTRNRASSLDSMEGRQSHVSHESDPMDVDSPKKDHATLVAHFSKPTSEHESNPTTNQPSLSTEPQNMDKSASIGNSEVTPSLKPANPQTTDATPDTALDTHSARISSEQQVAVADGGEDIEIDDAHNAQGPSEQGAVVASRGKATEVEAAHGAQDSSNNNDEVTDGSKDRGGEAAHGAQGDSNNKDEFTDDDEDDYLDQEIPILVRHPKLVKSLTKYVAHCHPLLSHRTEEDRSSGFDILRRTMAKYFVDVLGCNAKSLKPDELKIVQVIAKCFQVQTFECLMDLGRDLLTKQTLETNQDMNTQKDLLLPSASRAFAEAIRQFDAMQAQRGIDRTSIHLRSNIRYIELLNKHREALEEMQEDMRDSRQKKLNTRTNPKSWLRQKLQDAELEDKYKLFDNHSAKAPEALRVLHFYQRNRAMSRDENDFESWNKTLDEHLERGRRIKLICSFDDGLCGLLPHNIKELLSIQVTRSVTQFNTHGGKAGLKKVHIFQGLFQAIQDSGINIKLILRALWTHLLVKIVKGKPINAAHFNELNQLITHHHWDAISDDLSDGSETESEEEDLADSIEK